MPPQSSIRCLNRQFSTATRRYAEEEATKATISKRWHDRKDIKDMMQWIQLEGQKYKRPADKGGPNYLKRGRRRGDDEDAEAAETEKLGTQEDLDQLHEKQMRSDLPVRNEKDLMKKLAMTKGMGLKKAPRPFDLNPYFASMPVLSEHLKESIYNFVVHNGKTVKAASEHFRVSIERVVAVVRMKQIERNWVKEVSFSSFSSETYSMMNFFNIR
jgi:hypothetical protein